MQGQIGAIMVPRTMLRRSCTTKRPEPAVPLRLARPEGFEPPTVARDALAGCALLGGAIPSDSSPYHLGELTLPRTPLRSGVQIWLAGKVGRVRSNEGGAPVGI